MSGSKKVRRLVKTADDPEFFNGCKFYVILQDIQTERSFLSACGKCDGCRMHKHETIVSGAMAEAQTAACTLSVCLTVADTQDVHGNAVTPDDAKVLNYEPVRLFLMRLVKSGYRVRKLAAGEYGSTHSRAHWHLLLFFQWDEIHLKKWADDFISRDAQHLVELRANWRQFVPPLVVADTIPRAQFQSVLDDPETLWTPRTGYKTAGNYRQNWKYWPHGLVEAQLVSAPGIGTDDEQNRAVRYVCKYISKDPWKDVRKFRHLPFDQLPPHIQEATNYQKIDGAFVRGNPYRDAIEKENLERYASDDDVPIHRKMRRNVFRGRAVGGLGRDYFRALGAATARLPGADRLMSRTHKLGPSYRKKHVIAALQAQQDGRVQRVKKNNRFYLTNTQFRQFAIGYNAEKEKHGLEPVTGVDHIFDTLDTASKQASDYSSGPMGHALWKKASKSQRATLEKLWSDLPDDRLVGLVPARLRRLFEDTSKHKGWQEKKRKRLERERFGRVINVTDFHDFKIVETAQKRFFYEKQLRPGVRWHRREIITEENLQSALKGGLLPENARSARMDQEGQGSQKLLSDLDIRTVRKRISREIPDCPF